MSVFESLDSKQQELIQKHLRLVIEANKTTNLTRIDDWESAMLLHIEDSLMGIEELNECPQGDFADLGSGAGFPGIPLSIATGRNVTLIDSRKKKMDIVGAMAQELGLDQQVSVYAGRAELFARTQSKRYEALTARALAKLSVIMELASPLLKTGGSLICYKSEVDDSELAHARRVQKATGMKLSGVREFLLGGEYKRSIITFKKTGKPEVSLPRLEGQAQKNPL